MHCKRDNCFPVIYYVGKIVSTQVSAPSFLSGDDLRGGGGDRGLIGCSPLLAAFLTASFALSCLCNASARAAHPQRRSAQVQYFTYLANNQITRKLNNHHVKSWAAECNGTYVYALLEKGCACIKHPCGGRSSDVLRSASAC